MNIEFDHTNLLASMVHEHGLTSSEIRRHAPKALAALRGFRALSEKGDVGFPHLPFQVQVARKILDYAGEVRGSYDTLCVAGIGGSALGAWALDCALRGPHPVQPAFSPRNPRLVILDNVDPSFVTAAVDSMDPRKTLVLVISKSGEVAETLSAFLIVRQWLARKLGRKAAGRIAAVTGTGKGDLYALAQREHYPVFEIPANVGGRFSVLSPVGLLPAALIGLDIRKLMKGAAAITHWCWQPDLKKNPALRAALLHYLIWTLKNKSIHVAFPYSNRLWGTAFWFRQLWAESLGKAKTRDGATVNVGQTPVAALGATDQHSQVQLYIEGPNDKVFTFWAVGKHSDPGRIPKSRLGLEAFDCHSGRKLADLLDAERRSTAAALVEAGRPNCTFTLGRVDEEHLGAFLQLMEFQTAFLGELLNINAFNQPGVELGKHFTYGLMGRAGYQEYRQRFDRL
ncbi:MAG: glucose-6-phosphate isomerase, partial [Acidobacteriota bacterium]